MGVNGRDVTVAGGGVAGLAAARALALRGARVTVLEQAPAISEVGAGLQVSPNGGRVIDALGLGEAFRAASGESAAVVLRDAAGRRVLRMALAGRGRFALVHRADLIAVLERGAREAGVTIELGARVEALTLGERGATVRMADGGALRPGLLVGADGLHSRVRAELVGEARPRFTGQVAWRALIPCPEGVASEAQVFMGPGRHLVAYPLRGGRLLNIVAVEERAEWAEEGWHNAGDPDELRAAFRDFGGSVREWLGRVERCMLWGLFRHPVAGRWHAPGVAILGDAAHPTLPFLAQGACMALEDAWTLAATLDAHDGDAAALAAWQGVRRPRTLRIVDAATANARNYHLRGARAAAAHAALRAADRLAPGAVLGRFDWLYGHDVTA
ncbi:monooxygenase [Rhodovulum sp. 12E13]|uniref:FAD-dependent oxidoreductase n=1 Tax=Rhodovulum sp. 12E13 TaxID=2203891 RepID=UPI000E1A4A4F|nr:FAD-dependent oxidoreductase [Rhodovulum sp. 12E13]RDC74478.1 monooxygenase [Rhodovulum sp. 12E13]